MTSKTAASKSHSQNLSPPCSTHYKILPEHAGAISDFIQLVQCRHHEQYPLRVTGPKLQVCPINSYKYPNGTQYTSQLELIRTIPCTFRNSPLFLGVIGIKLTLGAATKNCILIDFWLWNMIWLLRAIFIGLHVSRNS